MGGIILQELHNAIKQHEGRYSCLFKLFALQKDKEAINQDVSFICLQRIFSGTSVTSRDIMNLTDREKLNA